ncbi:MAG: DUF2092 domain-containing protein [Phycisphaerae bacterium]
MRWFIIICAMCVIAGCSRNPATPNANEQKVPAAASVDAKSEAKTSDGPSATTTPSEQVDPRALLQAALRKTRAFAAFTVDCHITRHRDLGGVSEQLDLKSKISYRAPNLLRVVSTTPAFQINGEATPGDGRLAVTDIYCDGETVWYVMPTLRQFIKRPAPATIEELLTTPPQISMFNYPGMVMLPVFVGQSPDAELVPAETSIAYEGRRALNDDACDVLRVQVNEQIDQLIWIDAEKAHIRQVEMSYARAQKEGVEPNMPRFVRRFSNWRQEAPTDRKDYQYSPGPEIKEVEDFVLEQGGMSAVEP